MLNSFHTRFLDRIIVSMLRVLGCLPALLAALSCGDPADRSIHVVRVAPEAAPLCGAPGDARIMILRALGDFPASEATAQSVELGSEGEFSVERFPTDTRMLEAEVRGFGGALRAVGRSAAFSLDSFSDEGEITIFMAPLEGACATGPVVVPRMRPMLASAGDKVLVVGGTDLSGNPSLEVELYSPTTGSFLKLESSTYGDTSALGLAGASITRLPGGDVVIAGGAATAYQVFSHDSEEFAAPAFYREARGRHAAVALSDGRLFLAAGCSQVVAGGCSPGSLLRTSALLDLENGEIELGPTLQVERVGGSAWLERPGQIVLVGGVDRDGEPIMEAERVFLSGGASQLITGLGGASAQAASGTLWTGLGNTNALVALAPDATTATSPLQAAFAEQAATLIALDDGSLLALGETGAQRIRSFDGQSRALEVDALEGRSGQAALALPDGTILVVGGQFANNDAAGTLIYRPSLLGPLSASLTASFSSAELSEGLSAADPTEVRFESGEGAHVRLDLGSEGQQYVLMAPQAKRGTLQAVAGVSEGASVLFYFGWQSPSNHHVIEVAPGEIPVLMLHEEGGVRSDGICEGSVVSAAALSDASGAHEMELIALGDEMLLRIDSQVVLRCSLSEPSAEGRMGLGLGGVAGGSLRLDLISFSRET